MTHGDTAAARLQQIAEASATPDGVTRLPWTREHRAALRHITSWMEDAGLDVSLDAAGTLVGSSPNPEGKPVLLIGSHQDSVPCGGRFDGIMGIVVGCLAAGALRDQLGTYPFALQILAFADEEGVRFPTALIGPRALAGTLAPTALDMADQTGVTMRQAMEAFGVDTTRTLEINRAPETVFGYLEAHIEQGPVLEARNLPIAAVSAICGISRFDIRISGETGHAGTVPMSGRRDALVAASRIIAFANEEASSREPLRATIGQISVAPGAVNAIPSQAQFPLEVRSDDDETREEFEAAVLGRAKDICDASGCELSARRTYVQPAAKCDPQLTRAIETAIKDCGFDLLTIPSGATHDASAMSDLCPVSMIFVRCRGGVSHRPDEFASPNDMEAAVAVLARAIENLAKPGSAPA